jgi:hypothetical protein
MPNRILRDWTGSTKVENLTVHAERFFTRLIMKADDYGRYHANPKLLKPHLFPLLIDQIRETDISRWTAECEKAGLIAVYEIESKQFLQIMDFNQRLRLKTAKFPNPPFQTDEDQADDFENDGHTTDTRLTNDGHMSDTGQSHDGVKRSRREVEEKGSRKSSSAATTEKKHVSIQAKSEEFYKNLVPYVGKYGKNLIRAFYDYWSEPNKSGSKIRMELEKTWDMEKRLNRWSQNDSKFSGKNSTASTTSNDLVL